MPEKSNLSSEAWWDDHKNKDAFKKSSELSDLESSFKTNVTEFKQALDDAGASISIDTTKRSKKRAYVLHYAWRVAKGEVKAKDVPSESGVDIEWVHNTDAESIAGAQEIVTAANMASVASLTSRHISGKAIDWTITWVGTLEITQKDGTIKKISTSPKNGGDPGNTDLHEVGKGYGVVKGLFSKKDPPHWSNDGH